MALGEVGLILSRELSRLLRTDKDFCQLVELCQLFGTLVGDEETLYDTSRMDDQLVLGIKATISVVELKGTADETPRARRTSSGVVSSTRGSFDDGAECEQTVHPVNLLL